MSSLLNKLARGAVAGVAATVVMSIAMAAGKKVGALGEPPPRRLTRRLLAPLGPLAPSGSRLDVAALLAHLGFGATMGSIWGLLPRRWHHGAGGALFGFGVWTANYAGWLPAVGLMPPPQRDRPLRPTTMILAHLVYGAALARVTRLEEATLDGTQS